MVVYVSMVNHMRHTRSHTANRRSHHALINKVLSLCSECAAPKLPHRACLNCGSYGKGKKLGVSATKAAQLAKKAAATKKKTTTKKAK